MTDRRRLGVRKLRKSKVLWYGRSCHGDAQKLEEEMGLTCRFLFEAWAHGHDEEKLHSKTSGSREVLRLMVEDQCPNFLEPCSKTARKTKTNNGMLISTNENTIISFDFSQWNAMYWFLRTSWVWHRFWPLFHVKTQSWRAWILNCEVCISAYTSLPVTDTPYITWKTHWKLKI